MSNQEEKPDVEQTPEIISSEQQSEQNEAGEQAPKESVWDKVTGFTQKGLDAIKSGAEKVTHIADEATKLAKLKYEIYSLQTENQTLQQQAGQKIWLLYNEKKLDLADEQLADGYEQYIELTEKIEACEKEAASINLAE